MGKSNFTPNLMAAELNFALALIDCIDTNNLFLPCRSIYYYSSVLIETVRLKKNQQCNRLD